MIGHELGHIITHQQADEWSMLIKKALGATSVSDRNDIEDKVQRVFFEYRSASKVAHLNTKVETEQQDADRVGMEAVVRAGYRPEALADLFDRTTENKGRKGNWLSDLAGFTATDTKRYREMLKRAPKLGAPCIDARQANTAEEFGAWKKRVAAYRGTGRRESLHRVVLKRQLDPPLQDQLNTLRFSPNGKFLLAQDSGTVYVARRQPLEVIFRFEAPNAYPAMFTPDSTEVIVYDSTMRVERWDIESQERTDAYEVSTAKGCLHTVVSPDGNTLACLEETQSSWSDFTLVLIDTESNERFFERKFSHGGGSKRSTFGVLISGYIATVSMGFSPDGRYFLASAGASKPVAYDLKTHTEMDLQGTIGEMLKYRFTFLGPDRIAGMVGSVGERSRVVRFPTGELLNNISTGYGNLSAPAHGEYLLLRPVEGYAVGVLDISQNKIVRANKTPALDVYDDTFVSELGSGEIGLFQQSAMPIATLKLPRGRLGPIEAGAVSPDFRWLAISVAGRGAVWDLANGERLYHVKGFQGAYIAKDGSLYVDFPKQDKSPRNIVRLGLQAHGMSLVKSIAEDEAATEHGPFLTRIKSMEEKPQSEPDKEKEEALARATGDLQQAHYFDVLHARMHRVVLEVIDTQTSAMLWSRRFEHEMPWIDLHTGAHQMALLWFCSEEAAKSVAREAGDKHLRGDPDDFLVEVLDASTGQLKGRLLVSTSKGMFRPKRAFAAGDRVFVTDNRSRILVYSLKDGSLSGRMFGALRGISGDGSRICVQHERGRLTIYDAASLNKVDEFAFSQTVTHAEFHGNRLFVVTADQTAYGMELQ